MSYKENLVLKGTWHAICLNFCMQKEKYSLFEELLPVPQGFQ